MPAPLTYTYQIEYVANYDTGSGTVNVIPGSNALVGGTISANAAQFIAGNPVSDPDNFDNFTYLGYVTVSGTQYPVLQDPTLPAYAYILSASPTYNPAIDNLPTTTVTAQSSPFCFLAGTLIATSQGDIPVEALKIGDEVLCTDGSKTRVFWIGNKTMSTVFAAPHQYPIEISAGALGVNIPQNNLRLMPAHAILIANTLVVAGQLVNGQSIKQLSVSELGPTFTYYAVETEGHSVIMAEGAPVESKGNIKGHAGAFDNWDEYVSLYGENGRDYPALPNERIRMTDQLPDHIYWYVNSFVAMDKAA